MNFRTGVGYDLGRARAADPHNEDYYGLPNAFPPETRAQLGALYVVADGIGGHTGGEVASQAAVKALFDAYYADASPDRSEALRSAIAAANQEVYQLGQGQGRDRMGSTVAAAVIRGNELIVGNVGDSRVYLLRGGSIQPVSQDHTWVAERMTAGDLTEAEARAHPQRHVLTRSLGEGHDVLAYVTQPIPLIKGDRLLLCSDGLWELVSDAEIAQIASTRSPQQAAQALVAAANARGGYDNITTLVVPVGESDLVGSIFDTVRANPVLLGIWAAAGLALVVLLSVVMNSLWGQVDRRAQALPTPTTPRTSAPVVDRSSTPAPTVIASPTFVPGSPCSWYSGGWVACGKITSDLERAYFYSAPHYRAGQCGIRVGKTVALLDKESEYGPGCLECISTMAFKRVAVRITDLENYDEGGPCPWQCPPDRSRDDGDACWGFVGFDRLIILPPE